MYKKLIITVLCILSCGILFADIKKPNKCEVFKPVALLNVKSSLLEATVADKLAKSSTYGQDVIPQGNKKHWNVYSDRSENKTYQEPRKNSPVYERLEMGEELRIAKIQDGFALVYHEPKKSVIYPIISEDAVVRGWIPMENLLLWSTCPVNEKGIYNKALITVNMDNINAKNKVVMGNKYKNPDKTGPTEKVETGMTFYFIMKQQNDMVLLAYECDIAETEGQLLYGWVDKSTYVPWNQRSCIEPNWNTDAVARLESQYVSLYTKDKNSIESLSANEQNLHRITRYRFGGEGFPKEHGVDKYRMPANILRYPILANEKTPDSQYRCTTFGILGKTLNQHLIDLAEAEKEQENKLNDMSKLNLILVIDGTRSMGKYFSAVKDAIKEGCNYLMSDSEKNQYKAKVGLVIYRDYADGEQGLIEYLPMSEVNDIRLNEYLDNVGKYGAKSASADRTNEEALYKGLEVALDNQKMGYGKTESNLMLVIGDCGNAQNDTQCLSQEEIIDKLVDNRVNLMAFQVRRNNNPAWLLFNRQMRDIIKSTVQGQYTKLGLNINVDWKEVDDGYELNSTNSKREFFVASRRYDEPGVDMEVSKLTLLMVSSIRKFGGAIADQRAAIYDFVRSNESDDNAAIDKAFAISTLGEEVYNRLMQQRAFVAVMGYTDKNAPGGDNYWNPVIYISKDEFRQMMVRLAPVNAKANAGNRKEYVSALQALVRSMVPDITPEEMAQMDTGEIMRMITGLNVKSAALSGYRLVDIQDPTVVREAEFRRLVQDFKAKFKGLQTIFDGDYDYVYKSGNSSYYWIPVEQLP